jgi:predicted O-methyltransferase YrrM
MHCQEPLKFNSIPIDDVIYRYRTAHMLNVAVENGIFTKLTSPKKAQQLAEEIHHDPRATERLLNVLVASGLLIKSGEEYHNSVEAQTFLAEDGQNYIGDLVRITVGCNALLDHLKDILKKGSTLHGEIDFDRIQLLGHAQGALCEELDLVMNAIKSMPEFLNSKRILDLGGGHGVYSMALAQSNSASNVALFDQPNIIEFAKGFIAEYEMDDKIRFMSGDFNADDIGTGYDMVFVSHVFYLLSDLNCILRKIYNSLNDGGIVVLNHWMMDDCRTSPKVSVIFDLYLSLISRDYGCRTVSEFNKLLGDAGFGDVRVFDIRTAHSPSMIVVGLKKVRSN